MALTTIPVELLTLDDGVTISTADNDAQLILVSTDADADIAPLMQFYRNSGTPADNDQMGRIEFKGRNDNTQDVNYATVVTQILDASDGAEDGRFAINTMVNGVSQSRIDVRASETIINNESIDLDFRVESDVNTHSLFVDGETGKVALGTSTIGNGQLIINTADENHIRLENGSELGQIYLEDGGDLVLFAHGDENIKFLNGTGTGTERVRIKSDGTVGIGDDDPETYLTIKYNSTSQSHGITVRNLQSGGYGAAFTVKSNGDSEAIAARFLVNGENNWGDSTSQDSTIYLQTLSDNVLDGRLRIYSSGYTAVKGHMTPWTDNTYDLGQSSYRWDDIYATNNTIQTSDKNLKDNITESDLGLSFIKELKPVSYKWKDKTRTHYGLIAQDVKETLDSISKSTTDFAGYIENKQYTLGDGDDPLTSDKRPIESEDKILGLRYQEFLAPLIKAVQEQQALIETLEAKVKALEEA